MAPVVTCILGPLTHHLVGKHDDIQSSMYSTDRLGVAIQSLKNSLQVPWKIVTDVGNALADAMIQASEKCERQRKWLDIVDTLQRDNE